MVDPLTSVGAGLAVLGSKDVLIKLLGPTADYLGGEILSLVEKCNINLDNIFKIATNRLGNKIEGPGQVNPKVLKHIIDEGRFCEDEVTAEYFGGILASSRTEMGRDDRGTTYLSVIEALSSYQLRLHYLLYFIVHNIFRGKELNILNSTDRAKMKVYVPMDIYVSAMDFSPKENALNILTHSIEGLSRQNLIGSNFHVASLEHIKKTYPDAWQMGLTFIPSAFGAELFLWVFGYPDELPNKILDPSIKIDKPQIKIIDGSVPVNAMKPINTGSV